MTKRTNAKKEDENIQKKCGIVMPISGCANYASAHWGNVLAILKETLDDTDFQADLVSEDSKANVILNNIVNNLYDNQMVICDVSSRNPNVMFELGLRLAFDKPTIIIKDSETPYPFDVSAIEFIEYPRNLCYNEILRFKEKLRGKLVATYEASQSKDKGYKSFLSHFGKFTLATIDETEVTSNQFIIQKLEAMEQQLSDIRRPVQARPKDVVTDERIISAPERIRAHINIFIKESETDVLLGMFKNVHFQVTSAKDLV